MPPLEGRDLSHYDGDTPDLSGLSFTICKATQGLHMVDPMHDQHVAQSKARGLVTGSYHFLEAGDGAAQAEFFLAHTGADPVHLYAVDVEMYGTPETHPAPADLVEFHTRFHQVMPGRALLVYSYASFWHDAFGGYLLNCPHCRLWSSSLRPGIPQPGEVVGGYPQVYGGFPALTLHQYATSPVDRDRFYGTHEQLMALASRAATTPSPQPAPTTGLEVDVIYVIEAPNRSPGFFTSDGVIHPMGSGGWTFINRFAKKHPGTVVFDSSWSTAEYDLVVRKV